MELSAAWASLLTARSCPVLQCCRSADVIQLVLFPLGSTARLGATIASHTLVFLCMHQGRITPCVALQVQHQDAFSTVQRVACVDCFSLHWQACFSWSLLSGACSDCCTSYTLVSLCFLCHQWCRMEASALVVSHPCGWSSDR